MPEYMEDPTQYFTVLEERIGDTQQCTGGEVIILHYGLAGCNFVLVFVPGAIMGITENCQRNWCLLQAEFQAASSDYLVP